MELERIQQIEADDSKTYFPEHEDSPFFLALALVGEVGEICNNIKKHMRGDFDLMELRARVAPELPDVLIYLVMLSDELGRNLEEEYHRKKEFNDARFGSGQGSSTTPE